MKPFLRSIYHQELPGLTASCTPPKARREPGKTPTALNERRTDGTIQKLGFYALGVQRFLVGCTDFLDFWFKKLSVNRVSILRLILGLFPPWQSWVSSQMLIMLSYDNLWQQISIFSYYSNLPLFPGGQDCITINKSGVQTIKSLHVNL